MTSDFSRNKPLCIGPLEVDPPLFLAPMAGFTNYAMRAVLRHLGGAGLLITEMVSARGMLQQQSHKGEMPDRLWGVADEPRPISVQIWDNDPGKLTEVGSMLAHEMQVSAIDLNFGCPARDIAQKAESGAYLLRDPDKIGRIIERLVSACDPVPVTAKIRLGLDRENITAPQVARAVEQAGGAALAVHGRTASEMYRGQADWDQIAQLKQHLQKIPLIGNGDIHTAEEAVLAFERYGVDGVMIGRSALSRPWIFRETSALLRGEPLSSEPTSTERRQILLELFSHLVAQEGPDRAVVVMRQFACRQVKGQRGARMLRDRLARIKSEEELQTALTEAFPDE